MPLEQLATLVRRRPHLGGRRSFVAVNPRHRRFLERLGLRDADDFLDLPGEVVSGHPDRHVVRVVLGSGLNRRVAFLKREHRVPWSARLANAWHGFGWASQSLREARTLRALHAARVRAPDWLACGEDGRGRAFLLIAGVSGAVSLRSFLHAERLMPRPERLAFARRLGRALARVHAAGFDHPDLMSKHVLIHPHRRTVTLLDWPRSRRRPAVGWQERTRDLAALHASLADDLAGRRERLACLRAYLLACGDAWRPPAGVLLRLIRRRAEWLLRRRPVRELRQPPRPAAGERLRWVEGEALCVTRGFWRACRGRVPDWLVRAAREPAHCRSVESLPLETGGRGVLTRSPRASLLRLWLTWLRGRRYVSPELRQSGLAVRLRRFGVPVPRLLAFGQRPDGAAFLLTEEVAGAARVGDWLAAHPGDREAVVHQIETYSRRLAEAGCRVRHASDGWAVRPGRSGRPQVLLADLGRVRTRSRKPPSSRRAGTPRGGAGSHE
jgi:tRNA A-37 threonylcarbamoyl transferase component Bud32